jgi:hypothetical protein
MSGFLLLRPMLPKGTSCLDFLPTPLNSLDTLTFSINTPDGLLYANENPWNIDNLRLKHLAINLETGYPNIELYVEKLFIPTIYEIGDNLLIKSLEFLMITDGVSHINTNLDDFYQRVKSYLTGPAGVHIINRRYCDYNKLPITIANTDQYGFCNVLTVPLPIDIIQEYSGNFPQSFKDVGGCILNKSIQPVVTLKLSCRDTKLDINHLQI